MTFTLNQFTDTILLSSPVQAMLIIFHIEVNSGAFTDFLTLISVIQERFIALH